MRIKKYDNWISEAIDSTVNTFLLDFGMFITMNLSKCEQLAKDEQSKKELSNMLSNINKPIVNGLKYSELMNNVQLMTNPKITQALFHQIDQLVKYIEPRIEKFVKDSDNKNAWLKKISELKNRYSICVDKIK